MDKYIKESDLFKRLLNVDFDHDYDGCIKFCQSIPATDICGCGYWDSESNFCSIGRPAANAVRYGRWKDVEPAPHDLFYATCSVCGERQTIEVANYCPMCGARMGRRGKCVDCTGGYCEEECMEVNNDKE